MQYHYSYLIGTLSLLAVWIILFLFRKDTRKEIPIVYGSTSNMTQYRLAFSYSYSNYVYSFGWYKIYKLTVNNEGEYNPDIEPEPIAFMYRHKGSYEDISLSPNGKKFLFNESFNLGFASTNLLMEMKINGNGLRVIPVRDENLQKAKNYWEK